MCNVELTRAYWYWEPFTIGLAFNCSFTIEDISLITLNAANSLKGCTSLSNYTIGYRQRLTAIQS